MTTSEAVPMVTAGEKLTRLYEQTSIYGASYSLDEVHSFDDAQVLSETEFFADMISTILYVTMAAVAINQRPNPYTIKADNPIHSLLNTMAFRRHGVQVGVGIKELVWGISSDFSSDTSPFVFTEKHHDAVSHERDLLRFEKVCLAVTMNMNVSAGAVYQARFMPLGR